MELPLLERATENGSMFALGLPSATSGLVPFPAPLIPERKPLPGEQYRFHFDMNQCVGCKCCVVACNEQNGNPADIQWRRVGEIEGGVYPETLRLYLSMGCNHCLEPTCMRGCPVNAYTKDPLTGIVLHNADRCIGCQYCTWNCSYGVPQYNAERGVVGKCDMCYGRLTDDREPACVAACPQQAIRVEIVEVSNWRTEYAVEANAPGLPSADDSVSTTRITMRRHDSHRVARVDTARLDLEHPHWALVFMTVLTQMAVGAILSMSAVQILGGTQIARVPAVIVVLIALFALTASTMHLGRPAYAFRALSMWRRSWLSREVLLFSLFEGAAVVYAALLWYQSRLSDIAGVVTAVIGCSAVYASARIYLVAARPAWDSAHTFLEFYLTALLTGTLTASLITPSAGGVLRFAASVGAAILLAQQIAKLLLFMRSDKFELLATGKLIRFHLFPRFCVRLLLLTTVILTANRAEFHPWLSLLSLIAAIASEFLGRYLFFVSVVPKNMAAPYIRQERAA